MSTEEQPEKPRLIIGKNARITRLDENGQPVGEAFEFNEAGLSVSGNPDLDDDAEYPLVAHFPDVTIVEIPMTEVSHVAMGLMLGHHWPTSQVFLDMGAEWEFDYADLPSDEQAFKDRLTRCYEIAAHAVTGTDAVRSRAEAESLPMPEMLIHGTWSSPDTRDKPIPHAWVLLDDGRIWEPISRCICDPVKFAQYTQCVSDHVYTPKAALLNMVRTGHYGRWA